MQIFRQGNRKGFSFLCSIGFSNEPDKILSYGFENSVIPVIRVIVTHKRNNIEADDLFEIQKPVDQTSNHYHIWEGGDIRGCKNRNDSTYDFLICISTGDL